MFNRRNSQRVGYDSSDSIGQMVATLTLLICFFAFFVAGCTPDSDKVNNTAADSTDHITLDWEMEPDPPSVGIATLVITLTDTTSQPITGAEVELEGLMSHPGMQPVPATAEEIDPGQYSAELDFSMAGDWYILVNATLADRRELERQIDISVRSP